MMKKRKESKELLKVYGISALLIIAGFITAYQFVGPAPTKNIVIATGGQSGAYYGFGMQYAAQFSKDGVDLTVLESTGSIDNLAQLMEDGRNVHAALIQGGIGKPEDFPNLESLGSLYYEPLWLFHHKALNLETLGDLKGKRIAIGSQGSGTYALAAKLLARCGVTGENSEFQETGGKDAIQALTENRADALFVVSGITSGTVNALIRHPDLSLYSFQRADAYVRNYKYLSKVILPRGSVDLEKNIPHQDITLVAPAANLIIRNDLHPALMYLFLMAADKTHQEGGLLEDRGAFPTPQAVGFPLNKEANRFYQKGPPFLMRVLPFWLATWLVRMFVMVIPLVTILYPLIKIAPPAYTWRVRRKVHKLYKQLHQLEMDLADTREKERLEKLLEQLNGLEHKAASVQVPASYLDAQYNLRRHIDLIRDKLTRQMDSV